MERRGKKELLQVIETLESKLQRYETKLSDLVVAYKGLSKEKEALEKGFKALSAAGYTEQDGSIKEPLQQQQGCLEQGDARRQDLQAQIEALTSTISTLTQEKSRIEANFLAEKKTLLTQKTELASQFAEERSRNLVQQHQFELQLQELRTRVRQQQQEREAEQNNHALMIRELQQLVASERAARELKEDKRSEEYLRKIRELSAELRDVQERLRIAEDKSNQPSPFLLQLQKELTDVKVSHERSVEEEHQRANEAEEKLKCHSIHSEQRVATLESRLSELSQLVGSYDAMRQQDKTAIHTLKERVAQLEQENRSLAQKQTESSPPDSSNLDVQTLIARTKSLLEDSNKTSENPVDITEVFLSFCDESKVHIKCQEELLQLKEEFEQYKLNAATAQSCATVEQDSISQQQVRELRTRVTQLRAQLESSRAECRRLTEQAQVAMRDMRRQHRQELASKQTQYSAQLAELEAQALKQRERTLQLLKEKDIELEQLKAQKQATKAWKKSTSEADTSTENLLAELPTLLSSHQNNKDGDLPTKQPSKQLLFYVEEMGRKDAELSTLRRQRLQAEKALHDIQRRMIEKEEHYSTKLEELELTIQRMKGSTDFTSIEYLKNVVLKFFLCTEKVSGMRLHMFNAIAALLNFSPAEIRQVYHVNQWGPAPSLTAIKEKIQDGSCSS